MNEVYSQPSHRNGIKGWGAHAARVRKIGGSPIFQWESGRRVGYRLNFWAFILGFGMVFLTFSPDTAQACATCYGPADSAMVRSMNAGIITLLIVIGGVLSGIVGFIFHLRKCARMAEPLELNSGGSNSRNEARFHGMIPCHAGDARHFPIRHGRFLKR